MEVGDRDGAGVLLLDEGAEGACGAERILAAAGFVVHMPTLSAAALADDRAALRELDVALGELARGKGVERERLGAVGLGRGGTLAFLLGCTRRLAAVVDVEGPVLHPALSAERPIQPLELALNFEGAFLGLFGADGPVGAEERELLRARLAAAARPFELVVAPGKEIVLDPRRSGYDEARVKGLWSRVLAFLAEHLAPEPE
jgi:dienelactone hydrolase